MGNCRFTMVGMKSNQVGKTADSKGRADLLAAGMLYPQPHVSLEGHLLCSMSKSSWYKKDVVDTELAND